MSGDEGTGGENSLSEHVVIYMARQPFRAGNEDLFTPLSVPIGPYHRASCSPRWAREKERVAKETVKSREDELRRELQQLEGDVRNCYGGLLESDMKSEDLVSMLLNDGCYVLQFFVEYPGLPDISPPRGEETTVMRDIMYLIENQLPMIILETIHRRMMTESEKSVVDDVEDGVAEPLSKQLYIREIEDGVAELLSKQLYIREKRPRLMQAPPSHLLQLVHTYFQPQLEQSETVQQRRETGNDVQDGTEDTSSVQRATQQLVDSGNTRRRVGRWRRATEYSRYGNVQLKRREFQEGVVESILDVRLEGSTLLIPRLRIVSSTWTILRNLMALEEQTGGGGSPVTAYCVFMSQLASKVEDIELLKHKEIVDHYWGNDEEVAQGFADLCKKVVLDVDDVRSNYLGHIWHRLQERCESLGRNCWGSFRHMHCGDSMRFLAFVTAGLLFAFQLIQVILAGFSLRQQQGK